MEREGTIEPIIRTGHLISRTVTEGPRLPTPRDLAQLERTIRRGLNALWGVGITIAIMLLLILWRLP